MQTDNPLRPPPLAYNIDGYDFRDDATVPPDIAARTDDSTGSDDAWAASCSALHDVERDYFDDQAPAISTTTGPDDDDGESDDASGTGDEPVARALRAPLQRSSNVAYFNNISNFRALRFLFDVSARVIQQSATQHQLSRLRGLHKT